MSEMLAALSSRLRQAGLTGVGYDGEGVCGRGSSEGLSPQSLLGLSTDVLLNLLVTLVDLKSLAAFANTCRFARCIISQTRIIEVVAHREWNSCVGEGLGELCRHRIGLPSFLALKQWEYRLLHSLTYRTACHVISDQFLFEDGNAAALDQLEGSMRIMAPQCFDASVGFAITAHEDDNHVYVWSLPRSVRVTRLKCEEPPVAVAVYGHRAVTLEKVPLPMLDSQFWLKMRLWAVPGSGIRQSACTRILAPPADFPFQLMVTLESQVAVGFGGGGAFIEVLSSWCAMGTNAIATYRCTMSHTFSADTGQLILPPKILVAAYDFSFFHSLLDWRGYKFQGVLRTDDLRFMSSRVDPRRVHLAAGIRSYVVASHVLRPAGHANEELLLAIWIQEFSLIDNSLLFSATSLVDPAAFESLLVSQVKITEMYFIESAEYRSKRLLVLFDCGTLLEYDLRSSEDFTHVRSFPSDGNVWNKHQGMIVCMRVVGSTLVTLGIDYSIRTWDLLTGLSSPRVLYPCIKEGFTPIGLQICQFGLVAASTNNHEDSPDFYGACHLHVIDFT